MKKILFLVGFMLACVCPTSVQALAPRYYVTTNAAGSVVTNLEVISMNLTHSYPPKAQMQAAEVPITPLDRLCYVGYELHASDPTRILRGFILVMFLILWHVIRRQSEILKRLPVSKSSQL